MRLGDKVRLISFISVNNSPKGTHESENYWKLIGSEGTIVQDPKEKGLYAGFSKEKRLLIQFDLDVKSFNLRCHNTIKNSLWILETDLLKM